MPMASRSKSPPPPLIRMREGEVMDTRPNGSVTKQLKKQKGTKIVFSSFIRCTDIGYQPS